MKSSKSLAAARYILERQRSQGDSVTPMQLIKLAYIAQGYMLGMKGRPLLDEQVEAWEYGPVVPSVYQAVKKYRSNPVERLEGDVAMLSDEEKAVLDQVADRYAKHSGITLSSATHKPGTPWEVTWSSRGKNSSISNDLIEGFYSDLLRKSSHSSL